MKRKKIVVIGTLDTRGSEVQYLKNYIQARGHDVIVIDNGILGEPPFAPDVTREEIARAGGSSLQQIIRGATASDHTKAIDVMTRGTVKKVRELFSTGNLHGAMTLGGATGVHMGTTAMKELPMGVPKLVISTVASHPNFGGRVIGTKDIMMLHSVVDMIGMNEVIRKILTTAAAAMVGMVEDETKIAPSKKLIGITLYGETTNCAMQAKTILEGRGYEGVGFHANGIGGRAMEELIEQRLFTGVLDLTIREVGDELFGGRVAAGPHRLEAAGRRGIPQVIAPGGLDSVSTGPPDVAPLRFRNPGRRFTSHSYGRGLARLNAEEEVMVAHVVASKLNKATGPVKVLVPTRGWSAPNKQGGLLYDPEADYAFVETLRETLKPQIEIVEVDAHINDLKFARAAVDTLDDMMRHISDLS